MRYGSFLSGIIGAFVVVSFAASQSHAGVYIGGLGGIDRASGGGGTSTLNVFGGNIGYATVGFGLGGYFLTGSKKGGSVGGFTSDIKQSLYGAEADLYMGSVVGLKLGIKAGVSNIQGTVTLGGVSSTSTSTNVAAGPTAGVYLKLAPFISLGGEGTYQYVAASTSYSVILGLGSLTFWF